MMLQRALQGVALEAVGDKTSSPSFTGDLAAWMLPFLAGDLPGGLYHACNAGASSWSEYGQEAVDIAVSLGWPLKTTMVTPVPLASMTAFRAARPVHTVMDCTKLANTISKSPRLWQDALKEYLTSCPAPSI
jgi:dTDP-4-dehydrorhamnose reductase